MDLGGVIPIPLEMPLHDGLNPFALDIRSGEAARIEQYFLHVGGQPVPIPYSEMRDLVPPQEEPFEPESTESMIDTRQPLGHSHVVCVLRLEREFEKCPRGPAREASSFPEQTAVRRDPQEVSISVANQPHAGMVACESRLRRAKDRSDKIVVPERRPESDLTLLECKHAMVVPGRLLEHGK